MDQWPHRFDLFAAERPFYQAADERVKQLKGKWGNARLDEKEGREWVISADEPLSQVLLPRQACQLCSGVDPHTQSHADPVRFRQIIRDLLTNAIRYGGDSVRIDIRHDNERVWIDVADSGEGVAFESRETIFEAYERAHRSVGLPGSVGLGLTVSRRLARLMDGDLTYRYDDDSIFTLELAVAPALMFWNGSTD